MDKKLAGLLGAAATLTAVGTVQADAAPPVELAPAATYGELLDPISNALALLKTDDARLAGTSTGGRMRLAQDHHHHHHHHHRAAAHHHHHHHRATPPPPPPPPPPPSQWQLTDSRRCCGGYSSRSLALAARSR